MLITKMPKTLIVGGGVTSALSAFLLHQQFKNEFQLSVWDKARGEGGRMSTSRSPHTPNCTADLGAQYITCLPHYEKEHKKYYDELLSTGVLEPLTQTIINVHKYEEGTKHYVVPKGMNTLVKYFSGKTGCQIQFDHHVTDITRKDEQWLVSTLKGQTELFDAIVLTMPTPQVLQLKGTIAEIIGNNDEIKRKLEAVKYSARYALGLFYEPGTLLNLPFKASYLNDDPVFRYIAVDNEKRNRPDFPPSVVLHTSVPFGLKYIESNVKDMEPILLEALQRSFPDLPSAKAVKCQKWRYSQVTESYDGQPGAVLLSRNPLLVVGGDAFSHSNFDGCISSAEKICAAFTSQ